MSTTKIRGIIVKERAMGESGKQLVVFAKDLGKLVVSCRGAKNPKSKYLAGAHVFCYSDFVLYEGSGFISVTQIDLIRNFSMCLTDIYKFSYGAYMLELIDKTVMHSQENNDLLLMLLKSLLELERADNPKKVSAAFQIKFLSLLGFCPEPDVCSVCEKKADYGDLFFSQEKGFVCGRCRSTGCTPVSKSVTDAIKYISKTDTRKMFMFNISEVVLNELHCTCDCIIRQQLDIAPISLDLIKSV